MFRIVSHVNLAMDILWRESHGQPRSTDRGERAGSADPGAPAPGAVDPGGTEPARPGGLADGAGRARRGDRGAGGVYGGANQPVAAALRGAGRGGLARPPALGPSADDHRPETRPDCGPDP